MNVPTDWIDRSLWLSWDAPRNYVAGEQSYLDTLRGIAGPVCEDGYCFAVPLCFVREADNPYDQSAFRTELDGQLVGYLRRHVAAWLAPRLDGAHCRSFVVPGVVRGGSTRGANLGCHVWLDRRLAPGPEIALPDDPEWEVRWPPGDYELSGPARGR